MGNKVSCFLRNSFAPRSNLMALSNFLFLAPSFSAASRAALALSAKVGSSFGFGGFAFVGVSLPRIVDFYSALITTKTTSPMVAFNSSSFIGFFLSSVFIAQVLNRLLRYPSRTGNRSDRRAFPRRRFETFCRNSIDAQGRAHLHLKESKYKTPLSIDL